MVNGEGMIWLCNLFAMIGVLAVLEKAVRMTTGPSRFTDREKDVANAVFENALDYDKARIAGGGHSHLLPGYAGVFAPTQPARRVSTRLSSVAASSWRMVTRRGSTKASSLPKHVSSRKSSSSGWGDSVPPDGGHASEG